MKIIRRLAEEIGMILPHEHIFVDLQTAEQLDSTQVDPADVVALTAPKIEKIQALRSCQT
jgi:phosphotriesterase-related protein